MRAFGRLLIAGSIATVAVLGSVGPTMAECDGPPPPFAETVQSAGQIVIGDVVQIRAMDDPVHSSRFTIHVTHVVRGDPFVDMEVNDALMQPCAGNIVVGVGDRIALALNAVAFSPPIPANGVAWIDGPAPLGLETTTVEEVYKLAGVAVPQTTPAPVVAAPAPKAEPQPLPWPVVAAIAGLLAGAVLVGVATMVGRRD